MLRLICTFVVRIWHKQVFSWHGSYHTKTHATERHDFRIFFFLKNGMWINENRLRSWPIFIYGLIPNHEKPTYSCVSNKRKCIIGETVFFLWNKTAMFLAPWYFIWIAQSRQNLRCSLIQAVSQEEPSDRKPDPWPLWMTGHAQLKFVMRECSKTQIRLTGLLWARMIACFLHSHSGAL